MNFQEQPPVQEQELQKGPYESMIYDFLGEAKQYLSIEDVEKIAQDIAVFEAQLIIDEKSDNLKKVSYDKYKKSFFVDGQELTKGQIVASRHLSGKIGLPQGENLSLEETRLKETYHERCLNDFATEHTNKILAETLATKTVQRDALKSKAYEAIAKRSETESKQLGVIAEKLMIGMAEMISVDRPDLKVKVSPSNAYEDVENKIDFIIESTHKRRGASVEAEDLPPEHKSVGIQFTTNTSKQGHKEEQIEKAKERGVFVDDIVYVAIDNDILKGAMRKWEQSGKPLTGPWQYLPQETKKEAIRGLFHSVLDEDQEISLLKKF